MKKSLKRKEGYSSKLLNFQILSQAIPIFIVYKTKNMQISLYITKLAT